MVDAIKWLVGDPWHYAGIIGTLTFILGFVVGRSAKTNKYEIAERNARRELHTVLRTIELKRAQTE